MTYPETSTDTAQTTSSLVVPIPVPTHGPGGSFSVLAKTHVKAPPAAVLDAVRNTRTWGTWNTFCPSCSFAEGTAPPPANSEDPEIPVGLKGYLEAGSKCTIAYSMAGDAAVSQGEQGLEITVLRRLEDGDGEGERKEGKKGFLIAWKSTGRPNWLLRSERVMEFVDDGKGGTEYTCWETFAGLLGLALKPTVGGTLRERFGDYARDLRGFVEGGSVIKGEGEGK